MRKRQTLWLGLRLLLVGITVFFLARTIFTHWKRIQAFKWQFRVVPLASSVLLQFAALVLWATVWRRMVVRTGCSVSWLGGVRIYMLSNLAKYVPGSIWGYLSRGYLGKDKGLTAMGVGISTVWEVGSAVVASLLLVITIIPSYPGEVRGLVFWLVLAVALICFVGILPPVFKRWFGLLDRLKHIQSIPSLGWTDFLLYIASALGTHILVGTAFFLFARSLSDVSWWMWWDFVALWSFSATAGLVIILVPHGLGVKESLLALFLQPFLPSEIAALVSLASRVWMVGGELIAAMIIVFLHSLGRFRANNP